MPRCLVSRFVMRIAAASCVTPNASRKSSTARLRSFLACVRKRDRRRLGHEAARGEVVDLEALLEEVGVVGRPLMPEQPVRHRLQRHRAQAVAARDRGGRQIDAAVLEVGHRAGGVRQVVHVDQLEAELLGHDAHGAVGERARDVAGGLELLLGELLDLAAGSCRRPASAGAARCSRGAPLRASRSPRARGAAARGAGRGSTRSCRRSCPSSPAPARCRAGGRPSRTARAPARSRAPRAGWAARPTADR